MCKKHKTIFIVLNYIKQLIILVSTVTTISTVVLKFMSLFC